MKENADINYSYDFEFDIMDMKVPEKGKYKESIQLDTGIYLDFDENNYPINLEILEASKLLKIDKQYLTNPELKVNIQINKNVIKVHVWIFYKIHDKKMSNDFNKEIINNFQVPDMEANLAIG